MKLKKGFLKEHVSEHDANIRLEDYSTTLNEPEVNTCFSIYTRSDISRIGEEFIKNWLTGEFVREHCILFGSVGINDLKENVESFNYCSFWEET